MAIESNGQEDSFSLGSSPAELLPRRAPYGAGRSESDSEVFFDWRRHVGALLRYKWLIIISPIFGAALGYWVNRFIPPAYVAQATLWLENSIDPKGPEMGPIRQQELLRTYSWVALLRSKEGPPIP